MVESTTCGYGTNTIDNSFTNISGIGSTSQPYDNFTGGGKKKAKKKAKNTKKSKKKKTPLRKPISNKTKRMARMRMKSVINIEKRKKKLSKRLKQRKVRRKIINTISSKQPVSKQDLKTLSPQLRLFMSKIPSESSKISDFERTSGHDLKSKLRSKSRSKSTRQKKFEDARIGLAEILKEKPIYAPKSKSVIKFSDYKKPMTKEKAALMMKSKKKGKTR